MGYLSGSSPHVKSGAVSALSVLVYKDANLCVSISDLVPSLLSLLHSKDTETIKVSVVVHFQDQIIVGAYFVIA
jgi:ribosomal RNA-processing protein 12